MDAVANISYNVVEVIPGTVEAVVVRSRSAVASGEKLPTIVLPHGGPHANCAAMYVTTVAYLASLGYAVCYCNYRGSTGYGDAALQSLVGGAAGTQDVADCVAIAERAIADGIADPTRVCAVGGSHGGFLAAHLIGQRPDLFRCAVMRNPVTDIAAMVSATDIPDWCFVETLGREAYSDLPSTEALVAMRKASPVRYVSEVAKHARPVLMLLGGVDLRVPPTNGLRYAAALREAGGSCEVRVFPADSHGLTNPRTEFESFVTVAGFLRRNVMN
jgi:acylaminoacyl-peptidase